MREFSVCSSYWCQDGGAQTPIKLEHFTQKMFMIYKSFWLNRKLCVFTLKLLLHSLQFEQDWGDLLKTTGKKEKKWFPVILHLESNVQTENFLYLVGCFQKWHVTLWSQFIFNFIPIPVLILEQYSAEECTTEQNVLWIVEKLSLISDPISRPICSNSLTPHDCPIPHCVPAVGLFWFIVVILCSPMYIFCCLMQPQHQAGHRVALSCSLVTCVTFQMPLYLHK